MKKLLITMLAVFLGMSCVQASDMNFILCEYSDEYLAWQKLSDEEKETIKMPEMCKNDDTSNQILGTSNDYSMSSFSLKDDYVLGVRNQENSDSCWAFSSLASIESNLLKNNINTDYLSVAHLELMTQNSLYTPSIVTFNRTFNSGGTFSNASAYILNHWGPITEEQLPFNTVLNVLNNSATINKNIVESQTAMVDVDNIFTLTNEQGACSASSIETIKKYLVNYGALAAGIYFTFDTSDLTPVSSSDGTFDIKGKFINGEYYYYDGSSYTDASDSPVSQNRIPNHAVTIIGWDDNVEVTSFTTNSKQKGAWLVKNSYGEDFQLEITDGINVTLNMGNEGYFYVSYDDINICTNIVGYYDADLNISDQAYYYDYLGTNSYLTSLSNTNYLGTVFTKKSDKTEKIDKITFATYQAGVDYTVYYASNGALKNYEEIANGTTSHKGYMSITPNKNIYVTDEFSIIVKFESETNGLLPVAVSSDDSSNSYYNYNLTSDVAFISYDGNTWTDMTNLKTETGTTVSTLSSIRVYTTQEANSTVSSEVDTNEEVDNSASSEVVNPNDTSDITTGDEPIYDPSDPNDIENPQTGVISCISIIIGLIIIGTMIHFKRRNKMFKI